jgi:hypothetical protein
MKLLKHCNKSTTMNCWEDLFIQQYEKENKLITEQQTAEPNPLFKLALIITEHSDPAQINMYADGTTQYSNSRRRIL